MPRAPLGFIARQIAEIRTDRVLRLYGSLLALVQSLTAVYWLNLNIGRWISDGVEGICWPMFPNCEAWHWLAPAQINLMLIIFLLAGLATATLFTRARWVPHAFAALVLLNVVKFSIIGVDLRLRMNQHIMAFWVVAIFLFIPRKRVALKWIIVLFYFWAGFLKLNPEWLSGSALYKPLWFISGGGLVWACTYVVVLEIALVWGLLFGPPWLRWLTLGQLAIFHIFSFAVVGFFYPLLMFAILAIFPLDWWNPPPAGARVSRNWLPAFAMASCFSLLQICSKFIPGDTALTGEGRMFSLHMFDSLTACEVVARVRERDREPYLQNLALPLSARLHCDPLVYLSRTRRLCKNPKVRDLDLIMRSRRSTDPKFHSIVNIEDFCAKNIQYSEFSPNAWINKN